MCRLLPLLAAGGAEGVAPWQGRLLCAPFIAAGVPAAGVGASAPPVLSSVPAPRRCSPSQPACPACRPAPHMLMPRLVCLAITCLPVPLPTPPLQEIALKAEVGAARAKDAQTHRKEFITERCNAARDARTLRNRGEPAGRVGWREAQAGWLVAGPGPVCGRQLRCVCRPCSGGPTPRPPPPSSPRCPLRPRLPPAGVLRVHERLARERNKAKDDDRAMRLEALKVWVGGAGGQICVPLTVLVVVCVR